MGAAGRHLVDVRYRVGRVRDLGSGDRDRGGLRPVGNGNSGRHFLSRDPVRDVAFGGWNPSLRSAAAKAEVIYGKHYAGTRNG